MQQKEDNSKYMMLRLQTCDSHLPVMTNKRFVGRTKGLSEQEAPNLALCARVEKIKGFRYRESNPGLLGESQLS